MDSDVQKYIFYWLSVEEISNKDPIKIWKAYHDTIQIHIIINIYNFCKIQRNLSFLF